MEKPIVFQCCYCKLPDRKPDDRVSHGFCKPCLLIYHPEVYEKEYDDNGDEINAEK